MRVLIACTVVARLSQNPAMRANGPRPGASSPCSSSHEPEIFTITGLPTSTPTKQATAPR